MTEQEKPEWVQEYEDSLMEFYYRGFNQGFLAGGAIVFLVLSLIFAGSRIFS